MSKWRIPISTNDTHSPIVWVGDDGTVWTGHGEPPTPSGGSVQIVRWVSDGSSSYTLPLTPLDAQVVRRGQVLTPGDDYTISGADITFNEVLLAGDSMQALLIY